MKKPLTPSCVKTIIKVTQKTEICLLACSLEKLLFTFPIRRKGWPVPASTVFGIPILCQEKSKRFDGEVKLQSDAVKWGRPGTAGVTFFIYNWSKPGKKEEGTREIQMFTFYI